MGPCVTPQLIPVGSKALIVKLFVLNFSLQLTSGRPTASHRLHSFFLSHFLIPFNMGFTSRHPRYTIAGIVGLFVTILVFVNSEPSHMSRPYPPRLRGQNGLHHPPGYVEEQIKLSESYYQKSLKERQGLIQKWGPSPSQVNPFPSNGEFYTLCPSL